MKAGDHFAEWHEFDVREYIQRCYGPRIMDVDAFIIAEVIAYLVDLGVTPGSWTRAADVGTGPNLFPGLLLAPFLAPADAGGVLELIEIGEPNRRYLRDALAGTSESGLPIDIWAKFEDLMATRSPLWAGAMDRLRSVANVRSGDVFELPTETFGAVSAFFVTESITTSPQRCRLAVTKLLEAAKPGGLVVVGHMLGSTGWHAGVGIDFPAVPVTVEDLREWYGHHLDDLRIIEPPLTDEIRKGYTGTAVALGLRRAAPAQARRVLLEPSVEVGTPVFHADSAGYGLV